MAFFTNIPSFAITSLIENTLADQVILHASQDSTAIEARERALRKIKTLKEPKKRKGRPKKGEVVENTECELKRIEKQRTMTLEEMLKDLPTGCDKGAKKDSKGNTLYWTGYKLHLSTVDGGIPVSAIITSASMHDSQAAIPLTTLTAERIVNLYDLMDAAYDVPEIIAHSQSLGHVPLIDKNPRRNKAEQEVKEMEAKARKALNLYPAEVVRYNNRTTAERANARLKDEFGVRKVRVRGHVKVACHLMFGVLVLAADQLLKLVI